MAFQPDHALVSGVDPDFACHFSQNLRFEVRRWEVRVRAEFEFFHLSCGALAGAGILIDESAWQRAQHLQGASGIGVLSLFAAPLLSGIARESVKPRFFLLLVCRAERFVVDGNQPGYITVFVS